MIFAQSVIVADNVIVASALVTAGLGKAVSPGKLRSALSELRAPAGPEPPGEVPPWLPRSVALAEVAAGTGLLVSATRLAAAAGVIVLAFSFALFGVLGAMRGSSLPCGCLGTSGTRPLGPVNVLFGCALAAGALANFGVVAGLGRVPAAYSQYAIAWSATGVLVTCLVANRVPIVGTLRSLAGRRVAR